MSLKGAPKSPEHRAKLAAANLGKKHSPETLAKMRASQALRPPKSAETKAKMSAAAIGRPKSEETRARMSAAKKGKPGHAQSEESKAKLSAAHKGKKLSLEHVEKLRQSRLGKPGYWTDKKRGPLTANWRAAISTANRGRKRSPEDVARRSGSNSHFWGKAPAHGKRIEYRGILFRSSYEVRFARALDRDGIAWEYEPRVFDLGACTYRPDFFLPSTSTYWEVKGWLGPDSQRKTRLFRECYPEIPLVVATKPVLQLMRF